MFQTTHVGLEVGEVRITELSRRNGRGDEVPVKPCHASMRKEQAIVVVDPGTMWRTWLKRVRNLIDMTQSKGKRDLGEHAKSSFRADPSTAGTTRSANTILALGGRPRSLAQCGITAEMCPPADAANANVRNIDAQFIAVGCDIGKRCPAVFDGYRKCVFGCEAVADIDHHRSRRRYDVT
jgi:hypothetical protein